MAMCISLLNAFYFDYKIMQKTQENRKRNNLSFHHLEAYAGIYHLDLCYCVSFHYFHVCFKLYNTVYTVL